MLKMSQIDTIKNMWRDGRSKAEIKEVNIGTRKNCHNFHKTRHFRALEA